jgi:calcium-dependent protein kinase
LKVQHALRKFKGMSDIRKLMCEVISFTLLPDQITELRKEFEKLDVEQNGEISLDNLKKVLMANAAGSQSYYFTEDEVEDIINSMRQVHEKSTTIH